MIWTVPLLQVLLHDSMRRIRLVLKLRNHGDGFEVDGSEGNQYERDLIAWLRNDRIDLLVGA